MGCGDCENLSHSITVPMATDGVDGLQRIAIKLFDLFHMDVKEIRGIGLQVSKLENADSGHQGNQKNSLRSWLASASTTNRDQCEVRSIADGSGERDVKNLIVCGNLRQSCTNMFVGGDISRSEVHVNEESAFPLCRGITFEDRGTYFSSVVPLKHCTAEKMVGGSENGSTVPDDHTCWNRPDDMDYYHVVQRAYTAPDLAGEMAAALAAASIVFRDTPSYSKKLVKGAATVFRFALNRSQRETYSFHNLMTEPYYNSSGYYDEYMWGATWLYYATGDRSYLALATDQGLLHGFSMHPDSRVLSWDNKLPATMILLTRLRIFLDPGYPYEDVLRKYHDISGHTM